MSKLVTVGIPFFNNERTLAYSINSTIKQTYKNLEIILIDDGSTDKSLQVAQYFANLDRRITLISDGTNKGLISRLNQIISLSNGEYIARMDADDLMDLERIEKQVQFLNENPEVDVLSTGMISMTNNFEPIGKRCCSHNKPNIYQVFKNGDGILHASLMTKSAWSRENQYQLGFERAEDRELFTRTMKTSIFYNLTTPLYFYMDVQNITLGKHLKSYQSERKSLLKNWRGSITTKQLLALLIRSYAKSMVVRLIFMFKREEYIMKINNASLSDSEIKEFKMKIKASMA